jgi:cyclic di-GMP phosphodiesterase
MPTPLRVLLVEDNDDDAQLLIRLLHGAGYALTQERVETEAKLRQALSTSEWDIILCDYSLPGFNADAALLVVQESGKDIPVVIVTGTIARHEAVALMSRGAVDYVLKGEGREDRLIPIIAREVRNKHIRARGRIDAQNLQLAIHSLQAMSDARAADLDGALELIVRALDLRDKETAGHSQRVTQMTVRLARAMGVDNGALEHIQRGALLHDIGKMRIPDAVLLKPGPLSDAEWHIMRMHPVFAYELLYPLVSLRPALDIPRSHHERWDGSGYPRGLSGEAIPLAARIFAVVDARDALTSDRPYRRAWAIARAMKEIKRQAGSLFDPKVVAAFLREDRKGALS